MTKSITVVCDKCGELTETHLKKRQHPNSVQETYFKGSFEAVTKSLGDSNE